MAPLMVLLGWVLFGGSHLLLSHHWFRQRLVRGLGEKRFVLMYTGVSIVTVLTLALLVSKFGKLGPAGPDWGAVPFGPQVLGVLAFGGAVLAVAGLANYIDSAVAVLSRRRRHGTGNRAPDKRLLVKPLDTICRHPFFVGFAIVTGAHALLASHLAGTVFFAGCVVLSLAGIPLQDRKLARRHPVAYREFLARTSPWPFLARTYQVNRQANLSIGPLLLRATVLAAVAAACHMVWAFGYGAGFLVVLAIGAALAVFRQIRTASAQ